MVIRVLDQRSKVPASLLPLLQSLIREHGLFPYLREVDTLTLADRLALDAFRPDSALGRELVFHSQQSLVYEHLMDGRNVILSAPTSFWEEPSRRRLPRKRTRPHQRRDRRAHDRSHGRDPSPAGQTGGPDGYKVITHASQSLADRNLIVITQERLLEYGALAASRLLRRSTPQKSTRHIPTAGTGKPAANIVFDRLVLNLGENRSARAEHHQNRSIFPTTPNIEATFI